MFSVNRSSKVNALLPSWDEGLSWTVAVKGGLATAVVASLVRFSALPSSSVKKTRTLMALPASASAQGVAAARGAADLSVVGQPLVGERYVGQAVGIGDARR